LDDSKPLSSSIDKLLDSFFSKNFEDKEPHETQTASTDIDIFDFNLTNRTLTHEQQDTDFNLTDLLGLRTQSIEINIEKKSPRAVTSTGADCFSLSDLANEYLATPGSASTAADSMGDCVSDRGATNLVDLIDNEFSSRFCDFDLDTEMEKIDFSTETLLIKRKGSIDTSLSQISNSLTLRPNMDKSNEEGHPRSFNSYETTEILKKKLSKKRTNSTCSKLENFVFILNESNNGKDCLSSVFLVSDESLFGQFLCQDNKVLGRENPTNCLFEKQFDYSVQKEFLKSKIQSEKRRKIPIEVVSKYERRMSKTKTADIDSARSKKTGCKTVHNSKSKLKSASSGNRKDTTMSQITAFDFSIPSPDDIVIAKQKFAFKNMRYK